MSKRGIYYATMEIESPARREQEANIYKTLKKSRLLTHPTLARRDAPSPKQGRNWKPSDSLYLS
jgi:hypothetical protein